MYQTGDRVEIITSSGDPTGETGAVIKVLEASALVRLDGPAKVTDLSGVPHVLENFYLLKYLRKLDN